MDEPLAELLERMEGLYAKVADEERQAQATLEAKNKAIAVYDHAFSITASLVSTLLNAAGEKELAKRVRPSARRPGQTNEDAPSPGSELAE